MSTKPLTGMGHLFRLMIRLERVRLTVWVGILGLLPVVVGSSLAALYETEVSRRQLAASVGASPGLVALLGPIHGTSIGALTTWRIGTLGAVFVALMAVFTVIRHTRLDEETGRSELIGSAVVGRHATLASASLIVLTAGALIGIIATVGLVGIGESASGSLAFGLSWFLVAVVFVGVGAVTAQMAETTGGARALAGAVIGVFFALRMAGDGGSGVDWLSWLSPFGWVTKIEAFGGEHWWVGALFIGLGAVLIWLAFALGSRRDMGAGMLQPRSGPAGAAPSLSSPLGLSWRLHRQSLIGWSVSVAVFAMVWGGLADAVTDLFEENPQLAEIFESIGGAGALTDIFFNAAMGIVALIVSVYAMGTALTLRTEEEALRAEMVLATATSRLNWAGSHIVFAMLGSVLVMTVAGASAGVVYGAISGDIVGQVRGLLGAALVYVPAIWVMAGLAVAAYGLAPRRTAVTWLALVLFVLLGQLGEILQLPDWAMELSPFAHIPKPPAAFTVLPLLTLTAIAAGLLFGGLRGFQRRDLT